jgi:hypothetical protein
MPRERRGIIMAQERVIIPQKTSYWAEELERQAGLIGDKTFLYLLEE